MSEPNTRREILDSPKLRICRRQFQIWRKWQKVIHTVENTVGKGEIACFEQFLLFPPCFQKACFPGPSKASLCGSRLTLFQTGPDFTCLLFKPFENTVERGEMAFSKQSLLYSKVFPKRLENFFDIFIKFEIVVCKLSVWKSIKFAVWEREKGYPFRNKPWLYVWSTSLLKTLWKKEKLLVTSNFSFTHSVFYSIWELSAIFIEFKIFICELFQFGQVLKFVIW